MPSVFPSGMVAIQDKIKGAAREGMMSKLKEILPQKLFEMAGAKVEIVTLDPLRDYVDAKTTISISELFSVHEKDMRTRPQDFGKLLRSRVMPTRLRHSPRCPMGSSVGLVRRRSSRVRRLCSGPVGQVTSSAEAVGVLRRR